MLATNIANNAVTFITSALIAALLSAEDFGIYSIAINVTMVVYAVSEAGLSLSVIRHYGQETDEEKKKGILRAGIMLRSVISLILAIVAIPLGIVLSRTISSSHPIDQELILSVLSAGALGLWASARSIRQATQDYKSYAGLTLIYGLTRLVITVGLYATGIQDVIAFQGGLYLASPLITATGFYLMFSRQYGFKPATINLDLMKRLLAYGRWVVVSYVLSPLCYTLPLFMLMPLCGADVAGVYGVGLMFSAIIGPLTDALGAFLVPKVASYSNTVEIRDYIHRILGFFRQSLAGLILAMALCSMAFQVLFASKYPNGLVTMQLLLGSNLLASYGGMINCVTHALGLPHLNAFSNLGKVIISGTVTWILAPELGAPGAALAAASAAIAGEVGLFFLIRRQLE